MSLMHRFNAMPRAMKWLVGLGLALVAYFVAVEPLVDWSNRQRVALANVEKSIADRRKIAADAGSSGGLLERSIVAFGTPRTPVAVADPVDVLSRKLTELARKHDVTIKRRTEKITRAASSGPLINGKSVDRAQCDLVIECDTPQFLAMLKDMESTPEITTIASLRLQKVNEPGKALADSTILQVTLAPELWAVAKGVGGGGGATPEPVPATKNEKNEELNLPTEPKAP